LNVLVSAIGVGLGFGPQNITNNFFSGLILLFERPIKIGHRVDIAGAVGEVREIAARATTIVTDEDVAIVIPNSQFISHHRFTQRRRGTRHELEPSWQIDRLCAVVPCGALVGSGIGTTRTARRSGRARRRFSRSAPGR
jgi:Mechanosensitive ion channel